MSTQKNTHEAYLNLVNHSLQGLRIIQDSTIVFSNSRMEEICGYSLADFQSMTWKEHLGLIHSNDREWMLAYDANFDAGTEPAQVEYRIHHKNGTVIWLEQYTVAITFNGWPAYQQAFIDITERKHAEAKLLQYQKELETAVAEKTAQLQTSEKLYRSLVELAPEAIIIHRNNQIVFTNQAGITLFNANCFDELIGKYISALFPEEDAARVEQHSLNLLETGHIGVLHQYQLIQIGGTIIDVEIKSRPITYQGEAAILSIAWDITERKKMEVQLRESEELYRSLIELAPQAIYVHRNGRLLFVNPAATALIRMDMSDADKVSNANLADFLSEADVELAMERETRMLQHGETMSVSPFQIIRTDGTVIDVEAKGTPIMYQGEPAILSMAWDVTERKKMEAQLQESEELYRSLVEFAPQAIYVHRNGRFVFTNSATVALTKVKNKDALIGELVSTFASDIDKQKSAARNLQILEAGDPSPVTPYQIVQMDGNLVDIEVQGKPIQYQGKSAILSMAWDVTERKKAENQLQTYSAKQQALLRALPDLMFILDGDGTFLDYHNNNAPLYISPNEFVGKTVTQVFPARVAVQTMEHIRRALQTGKPQTYEYYLEIADSNHNYSEARVVVSGKNEVIVLIRDVTTRMQRTQQIEKQARQLETLRTTGLEIASELDLHKALHTVTDKAIHIANGISGALYLYNKEQNLLIRTVAINSDIPQGNTIGRGDGVAGKVWETEKLLFIDNYSKWNGRIPSLDNYKLQAVVGVPVVWHGNFLGVLTIEQESSHSFAQDDLDVLELFAMQAALTIHNAQLFERERKARQQGETLQSAVHALSSAHTLPDLLNQISIALEKVVPFDNFTIQTLKNNTLTVVNGRGNFHIQDLIGQTFDLHTSKKKYRVAIEEKRPLIINEHAETDSYTNQEYSWLGVPMLFKGMPVGLVTLGRIETKPYTEADAQLAFAFATEAALAIQHAKLFEELRQSETTAIQAQRNAEAANLAKSAFLANMSHELRTPLNSILGYTQLLQIDSSLDEQQKRSINVIHRSGEHLLDVINEILELSKIETGKATLRKEEFNLSTTLKTITDGISLRAKQKGLLFTCQVETAVPRLVYGDKTRLRQVLTNLLDNSIKFTNKGSILMQVLHLAENAEKKTCTLCFRIEDTGIGIADDELEKIFQPFEQSGSYLKAAAGTGLGLAISSKLVDMMGGEISVSSRVDEGSVFWFNLELPVIIGGKTAVSTPESTPRPIIGVKGKRPKVLIVDDVKDNRSAFVNLLSPVGFEVEEATDGQDAIEKAVAFRPDIILMDLRMPTMDGIKATRYIRKQQPSCKCIIIAISVLSYQKNKTQAIEAGCDDFITKPIQIKALLQKLRKHLGENWDWQYEEMVETVADSLPVFEMPPEKLTAVLLHYAQIGDVRQLRQELAKAAESDTSYQPLITELSKYASEYNMKKIAELLQPD